MGKLGNSSVRYELGLFNAAGDLCAEGYFIHVFVNKADNKPTPIPAGMRSKLVLLVM